MFIGQLALFPVECWTVRLKASARKRRKLNTARGLPFQVGSEFTCYLLFLESKTATATVADERRRMGYILIIISSIWFLIQSCRAMDTNIYVTSNCKYVVVWNYILLAKRYYSIWYINGSRWLCGDTNQISLLGIHQLFFFVADAFRKAMVDHWPSFQSVYIKPTFSWK